MMARTKPVNETNGTLSDILERIRVMEEKYSLKASPPNWDACLAILEAQDTIDVGVFGRVFQR
jgi:hypothetical protein